MPTNNWHNKSPSQLSWGPTCTYLGWGIGQTHLDSSGYYFIRLCFPMIKGHVVIYFLVVFDGVFNSTRLGLIEWVKFCDWWAWGLHLLLIIDFSLTLSLKHKPYEFNDWSTFSYINNWLEYLCVKVENKIVFFA